MCGNMGAYTDVVPMPLSGRVRTIDRCISHIVAALNAGGVQTAASCCGHGTRAGSILLEDGRTLLILPAETWDRSGPFHESKAGEIEESVSKALYPGAR